MFTKHELQKLFNQDSSRAFLAGIDRLAKDGILVRACYGIYIYPNAQSLDSYLIEYMQKHYAKEATTTLVWNLFYQNMV